MQKIIWVVGCMCSGKTYYSNLLGEMFDKKPFHLDHIDLSLPLVEAYRRAIKNGFIEGYTPFRNQTHYQAMNEAMNELIGKKEVEYILISPPYDKWKVNCIPIINCPTDENPPDYTKEEYEQEIERIKLLTNPKIIIC